MEKPVAGDGTLVRRSGVISPPTEKCFKQDYEPYSSILATFRGRVVDIGGGAGVARHYLPPATEYLVADPSLTWQSSRWSCLAGQFLCLANAPNFVRAVGEFLPFPDGSFDAALFILELEPCGPTRAGPSRSRTRLKPEGRFLIVLEDMPPALLDWTQRTFFTLRQVQRANIGSAIC
jgi:SAM-dependent methyltransferase